MPALSQPVPLVPSARQWPHRSPPEEVPVAMVYNGRSHAVLMATPEHLQDLATGFSLTEGIAVGVERVTIVQHTLGYECRMHLPAADLHRLTHRRRTLTSTSACGLCGVRTLAHALPAPASVDGRQLRCPLQVLQNAIAELRDAQPLHDRTGGAHAAGFLVVNERCLHTVREDVGRHNALDKLAGALQRSGTSARQGALLLTSRLSVELIQKAATIGVPIVAGLGVPTSLAVRTAHAAGITLVAGAGRAQPSVHTHAARIVDGVTR